MKNQTPDYTDLERKWISEIKKSIFWSTFFILILICLLVILGISFFVDKNQDSGKIGFVAFFVLLIFGLGANVYTQRRNRNWGFWYCSIEERIQMNPNYLFQLDVTTETPDVFLLYAKGWGFYSIKFPGHLNVPSGNLQLARFEFANSLQRHNGDLTMFKSDGFELKKID